MFCVVSHSHPALEGSRNNRLWAHRGRSKVSSLALKAPDFFLQTFVSTLANCLSGWVCAVPCKADGVAKCSSVFRGSSF